VPASSLERNCRPPDPFDFLHPRRRNAFCRPSNLYSHRAAHFAGPRANCSYQRHRGNRRRPRAFVSNHSARRRMGTAPSTHRRFPRKYLYGRGASAVLQHLRQKLGAVAPPASAISSHLLDVALHPEVNDHRGCGCGCPILAKQGWGS
jgi:hypothetical protein